MQMGKLALGWTHTFVDVMMETIVNIHLEMESNTPKARISIEEESG